MPATANNSPPEPLLVDAFTAARMLGISQRTLWKLTKAGEVTHVPIGRRVLYDPGDLRAYCEAQKRHATSGPMAG